MYHRMINDGISYSQALALIQEDDETEIQKLMSVAAQITKRLHGRHADLCGIVNAKSGLCSENCSFCAQSVRFSTKTRSYPLLNPDVIVSKAEDAQKMGAHEFCIVTSGRRLTDEEFKQLLKIIAIVRKTVAIQLDVSVGFLNVSQARQLKEAGITCVNHNVQTSAAYYDRVASTHSYEDRISTLEAIKEAGLEICCGVLLGMGESREDRIQAAFELKRFEPSCVPINLLDPRPGTPLENQTLMEPLEILNTIAVFRLILPKTCLKLAGGRHVQLGAFQKSALQAGINGLIIGEYLTTTGGSLADDFGNLQESGFEYQ